DRADALRRHEADEPRGRADDAEGPLAPGRHPGGATALLALPALQDREPAQGRLRPAREGRGREDRRLLALPSAGLGGAGPPRREGRRHAARERRDLLRGGPPCIAARTRSPPPEEPLRLGR